MAGALRADRIAAPTASAPGGIVEPDALVPGGIAVLDASARGGRAVLGASVPGANEVPGGREPDELGPGPLGGSLIGLSNCAVARTVAG